MANTIKLKRGSGSNPGSSDLSVGELAIRTDEGKIFTKKDDGSVAEISGGGAVTDGDYGDITVSSSGSSWAVDSNATQVANKLPLAGGTLTGNVIHNNGVTARFGNSGDAMFIGTSSDGTTNYIASRVGDLYIRNNVAGDAGYNIYIQALNGEDSIICHDDGGVELFYDNTKKAETVSGGFTVSGTCTATTFSGSGASLTTLNASNLSSGTVATARLGSGTASNSTFLRGDGSWASAGGTTINNNADNRIITGSDTANTLEAESSLIWTGTSLQPSGNLEIKPSAGRIEIESVGSGNRVELKSAANIQLDAVGQVVLDSDSFINFLADSQIEARTTRFEIQNTAGNSTLAKFVQGGACELYHDGNVRLVTSGWGTEFTGDLLVPDVIAHLGDTDTRIRFSSTDQFDIEIAGTRRLRANSSGIDVTGTCTATTFSGSGASLTSLPAAQLSGAIANGVTATTQSASDNSTKVATTAYTDTAISNLVDSSPSALNTLNELAAALGDDANFSTTVTNSIATKLPLAGGTLTGALSTNSDIRLAADGGSGRLEIGALSGGDLQLYHATNSYIINKTGDLYLYTSDGNDFYVAGQDGHTIIKGTDGSSVELFHNNTKRFETSGTGATLTGHLIIDSSSGSAIHIPDGQNLQIGTGHDIKISHNGSNSFFENLTGYLEFQGASNEKWMRMNQSGSIDLYYSGTKKAETVSGGFTVSGTCTATAFSGDGSSLTNISATDSTKMPLAGGTFSGSVVWDNASNAGKDWKWNPSQNQVELADDVKLVCGDSDDLEIYHDPDTSIIDGGDNLNIRGQSIFIGRHDLTNEPYLEMVEQGAVKIYYNNSKKIETTNTGVTITGTCTTTGGISSASELDLTAGHAVDINATHAVTIDSGYGVEITSGYWTKITPSYYFQVDSSQKIELNAGYGFLATGGASTGYPFKTQFQQYELMHNNGTDFMGFISYVSSSSVALGYKALQALSNKQAGSNTALGFEAGKVATGGEGTYIGGHCGTGVTSGSANTFVGSFSGQGQCGNHNVAVGSDAFRYGTGAQNTCIGRQAGDLSSFSGDNNLLLGYEADPSSTSTSNEITLGNSSITKFRIPGINFELADNGGTPTNGHVLTMASGGATWQAAGGTTINNNANNRIITGSGTANTLEGESKLTFDGNTLYCEGSLSFTHDSNDQVNFNSTAAWCVARFQVSGTNRGYVSVGSDTVYLGNNTDGSQIKLKGSSFQFSPNDSDWYDILTSNSTISATVADGCVYENSQTISNNYTMTTNKNGMSAGPITVSATVTIPSGSTWSIV